MRSNTQESEYPMNIAILRRAGVADQFAQAMLKLARPRVCSVTDLMENPKSPEHHYFLREQIATRQPQPCLLVYPVSLQADKNTLPYAVAAASTAVRDGNVFILMVPLPADQKEAELAKKIEAVVLNETPSTFILHGCNFKDDALRLTKLIGSLSNSGMFGRYRTAKNDQDEIYIRPMRSTEPLYQEPRA